MPQTPHIYCKNRQIIDPILVTNAYVCVCLCVCVCVCVCVYFAPRSLKESNAQPNQKISNSDISPRHAVSRIVSWIQCSCSKRRTTSGLLLQTRTDQELEIALGFFARVTTLTSVTLPPCFFVYFLPLTQWTGILRSLA